MNILIQIQQVKKHMDENHKISTLNGYAPPLDYPMETISGNFEKDVLKQVIGRDGCYFKQITENSGVKYIWHRRETNQIEVWGPQHCIQQAIISIYYRVYNVLNTMYRKDETSISSNSKKWMVDYYQWYNSRHF